MTIPSVQITVTDNGVNTAVLLPVQQVQAVIGCAVGGTVNVPIATTSAATLQSIFVGGPLVEAGGLVCDAGGTVIAVSAPIVTHGTAQSVQFTGTGTSVITTTLDSTNGAWDDYYVVFSVVNGGTVGVAGITFQLSLDAGRTFGPVLALGTATTYAIQNTGITLNFTSSGATLVTGDVAKFQTTAPAWNTAGIQAALNALAASQYAIQGWGSLHIVGVSSAAAVASIESDLDTLASNDFIFTRAITEARDLAAPTAWGGSGETEVAWMNSLATSFSATSARRVLVAGGWYNMQSAYPNTPVGLPFYRRALGWAEAVRRTQIGPQRQSSRVKDGALANIFVNPAKDPSDGFVYHDERVTPGLDAARFMSARTWPRQQAGFYATNEPLMSPAGSQFTRLVLGNIIDIACDVGYATGVALIGDDLRLQSNGTLYKNDALTLQNGIQTQEDSALVNTNFASDVTVSVNQMQNVSLTSTIPVTITVQPRGYVDTVTETIGLQVA